MMPAPTQKRSNKGFTLIEVMIVVTIVGILAAIAYPSYIAAIRKSNRPSAESYLMEIASRQQTYLINNRSYASTLSALSLTTPADVANVYTIAIAVTPGPP